MQSLEIAASTFSEKSIPIQLRGKSSEISGAGSGDATETIDQEQERRCLGKTRDLIFAALIGRGAKSAAGVGPTGIELEAPFLRH